MPDKTIKDNLTKLDELPPEARERVSAALKSALEREVAAGAIGAGAAQANIFSRGWVFSRLTPTLEGHLAKTLPEIGTMSEADFTKFANRLSELRSKAQGGG